MLEEYAAVFPTSLPSGLPPPRVTDHKIELLANQRAPAHRVHRMSLNEDEELIRQLKAYMSRLNPRTQLSKKRPAEIPNEKLETEEIQNIHTHTRIALEILNIESALETENVCPHRSRTAHRQ